MPRKGKVNSSLGKSIIRKRFEGQRRPTEHSTELHTTAMDDGPSWTKLQSITEQGDLEEFLHTAELAGTEFTAERQNIKIISATPDSATNNNPYLLSDKEERETLQRHRQHRDRLKIPRRPSWDRSTSPQELHRRERESFMEWRRGLAQLQEAEGLLMTPFERNLEVWRQLWRVLERSQLVVQIVDARNPMLFRCADLETYVREIDERKKCLMLINKADMLTEGQRRAWAEYFEKEAIRYLFFSAKESNEVLEREREREREDQDQDQNQDQDQDQAEAKDGGFEERIQQVSLSAEELRTRVLNPTELVGILMRECPDLADERSGQRRLTIGLVGYPNVGKSSTINALVGSKKVNVGSMPGKTKHFQTIHLTQHVVLCDCPGLVFPTFATTQADMVCNGVLPIDQLREFTGPSALVARRIPRVVLEALYGIRIRVRHPEEGGSGVPTAEELLTAYAAARGMFKGGEGNPDESRAARAILKDYVSGKLVFCHPPPHHPSGDHFNDEHYELSNVARYTRHLVASGSRYEVRHAASDRRNAQRAVDTSGSVRVDVLDTQFFESAVAAAAPGRNSGYSQTGVRGVRACVDDRGQSVTVDAVEAARLDAKKLLVGKKNHKKKRAGKQRSGKGDFVVY